MYNIVQASRPKMRYTTKGSNVLPLLREAPKARQIAFIFSVDTRASESHKIPHVVRKAILYCVAYCCIICARDGIYSHILCAMRHRMK